MPARSRPLIAALGLAAAASLVLVTAPASAAKPDHGWPHPDLKRAYDATVKYKSEQAAIADGYVRTNECVEDPKLGGMGFHYFHVGRNGLPDQFGTNPQKPAALVYAEDHKGGERKLVALEYIVPNTGQPTAPQLFGKSFDGPEVVPGVGSIYSLHAWIFKKNPKGVLTPYNPRVECCDEEKPKS
ncbi:hypothetical protein ACFYV5_17895 [Streptomyces sp. NPDC003035]|uniref:hypothetical protein n=1 Tax=unclassified Streptomyces TaxID=2593676 RepID=UPI0033A296DB